MYCPNCGAEMDEEATFCASCGYQIRSKSDKFLDDAGRMTGEVIEGAVEITEKAYEKTKPLVKEAGRKTKGLAKGVAKKLKGEEEKG